MKKNLLMAAMLLCAYNLQAAKIFYKDQTRAELQSRVRANKWQLKRDDSTIKVAEGRIGQCKARIGGIKESMKSKTPTVQTKYQGTVDKLQIRIAKLNETLKVARKKRSLHAQNLTENQDTLTKHVRSAKVSKSTKLKKVKKPHGKTKVKHVKKKPRHDRIRLKPKHMLPDETKLAPSV